MKISGIDYSLCSPAVIVKDGDAFTAHYLTDVKRNAKEYDFGWLKVKGTLHEHHQCEQHRYHLISNWALSLVEGSRVMMEDYALGAKGKVFHIGENAGLLKWKMWMGGVSYRLVGPTVLKKYATGKGNADKEQMHQAFVQRTGLNLASEMFPGSTKIGNPVSDIVDAYWLCMYGANENASCS